MRPGFDATPAIAAIHGAPAARLSLASPHPPQLSPMERPSPSKHCDSPPPPLHSWGTDLARTPSPVSPRAHVHVCALSLTMYACLFIAKECNVVLVYARAGLRVSWRSQILGVLVNLIHLWDYYLRSGSAHFPEDGPALFCSSDPYISPSLSRSTIYALSTWREARRRASAGRHYKGPRAVTMWKCGPRKGGNLRPRRRASSCRTWHSCSISAPPASHVYNHS